MSRANKINNQRAIHQVINLESNNLANRLVNSIVNSNPLYANTRDTYKDNSRPINHLQINHTLINQIDCSFINNCESVHYGLSFTFNKQTPPHRLKPRRSKSPRKHCQSIEHIKAGQIQNYEIVIRHNLTKSKKHKQIEQHRLPPETDSLQEECSNNKQKNENNGENRQCPENLNKKQLEKDYRQYLTSNLVESYHAKSNAQIEPSKSCLSEDLKSLLESKFNITEADNLEIGGFKLFPELDHYVSYGHVYGIKYKLWPPGLFITFLVRNFLGSSEQSPFRLSTDRAFQNIQNCTHQSVAVIDTALINPTFLLSRIPEEHRDRILFYASSLPNLTILPNQSIVIHLARNFDRDMFFNLNWMNFTPDNFLVNRHAYTAKPFQTGRRFNRSPTLTRTRFTINQLRKAAQKNKLAIFIVCEHLPSLNILKETYVTRTYTFFIESINKIETLVNISLLKSNQGIKLKLVDGHLKGITIHEKYGQHISKNVDRPTI